MREMERESNLYTKQPHNLSLVAKKIIQPLDSVFTD